MKGESKGIGVSGAGLAGEFMPSKSRGKDFLCMYSAFLLPWKGIRISEGLSDFRIQHSASFVSAIYIRSVSWAHGWYWTSLPLLDSTEAPTSSIPHVAAAVLRSILHALAPQGLALSHIFPGWFKACSYARNTLCLTLCHCWVFVLLCDPNNGSHTSFETSLHFYQATQRYNLEDRIFFSHRFRNSHPAEHAHAHRTFS